VLVEKSIKLRFTRVNHHDAIDPTTIHLHWVQLVQEAPKTDIQVFPNNGGIMSPVGTMRWTTPATQGRWIQSRSFFPPISSAFTGGVHYAPYSNYIVHNQHPQLDACSKLLLNNGVYFTVHCWPADICDISQQGLCWASTYSSTPQLMHT
jgi:hypothetical protein